MVHASSPTVWRRWLGLEIRHLREERGLSQREVGRACGWSGPRLSYLENAQQALVIEDLNKLLPLYGVAEAERGRFYEAVERSRAKGWWERFDRLVPEWLGLYIGLEQGAASIRQYSPLVFPGLVQIPEYTAAITRRDVHRKTIGEIDRLAKLRSERQNVLLRGESPLELSVLLDESVLYRSPGDDEILAAQLSRVADLATRPNITIRVVPLGQGVTSLATGGYLILTFPFERPESGVVFIEYRDGAMYLDDFEEVQSHILAFDGLADVALAPDESLGRIRAAVEVKRFR